MCGDKKEDEATLKLKLVEHQVRDRIEDRVWQRVKNIGWAVGIGVTLLGVVGLPTAFTQIRDTVSKEIFAEIKEDREALKRETEEMRKFVNQQLGSVNVLSGKIEQQSQSTSKEAQNLELKLTEANNLLTELEKSTNELAKLRSKYANLAKETAELAKATEIAMQGAKSAIEETRKLRKLLADDSLGKPTIYSVSTRPYSTISVGPKLEYPSEVFGSNFGALIGTIRLYEPSRPGEMVLPGKSIELDPSEIVGWDPKLIKFSLSDATVAKLATWSSPTIYYGFDSETYSPRVEVQTVTGETVSHEPVGQSAVFGSSVLDSIFKGGAAPVPKQ